MTRCMRFDGRDKAALRALDDFTISAAKPRRSRARAVAAPDKAKIANPVPRTGS